MESLIKNLINNRDYDGLRHILMENPGLANEGISYDDENTAKASPLHRICDGVFSKKYTDEEAVNMAKIFLENGAHINGDELLEKQDTPLIAASSLHVDKVAILYIENGADVHHRGCHGGTALHWASWCGRPEVVRRLIQAGAEINKRCIDFNATPLFWAIHGLKNDGANDIDNYLACVRILIRSGADKNIPNGEGKTVFDLLNDEDRELKELLNEN
jgi:ankyrin repeat protein